MKFSMPGWMETVTPSSGSVRDGMDFPRPSSTSGPFQRILHHHPVLSR